MNYDANDIADAILQIAERNNIELSNLHLQKLLYYAQGFSFSFLNKPLFSDSIEAWRYGPVVPKVYNTYRIFGANPIVRADSHIDACGRISSEVGELLTNVVNIIGRKDPWALVEMTHSERPWKDVYIPGANNVISQKSIKKYFTNMDAKNG